MTHKIEFDLNWEFLGESIEIFTREFRETFDKSLKIAHFQNLGPAGGNPLIIFEIDNMDEAQLLFDIYKDNCDDGLTIHDHIK